MKKFLKIILLVVCFSPILFACSFESEQSYLRIHIRANSNLNVDQNVKYEIKDEVVSFLTPIIANCSSIDEVKNALNSNKESIKSVCDSILSKNGFNYVANVKIQNEFFPTRAYGEYVLEADFYDALIIELGNASGDNWWCVVYPPLCFLNSKDLSTTNIVYKSKIYELINKFFN